MDNELKKELNEFMGNISESTQDFGSELQRTDEWHEKRLGKFTGSRFGDLMSCKSRAKGKSFSEVKWILDFGDTALTYIIERAIERATGERIETPTTWHMQWGTNFEDEGKQYFMDKTNLQIQECGFELFYKNAGASPDGLMIDEYGTLSVFELKCPATPQSHFKLMNECVSESHPYYWQLVGEMLAAKVDFVTFATYDPRYPEGSKLGIEHAELSNVHSSALKARIVIAEKLVGEIIENDFKLNVRECLQSITSRLPVNYAEFLYWLSEAEKPLLL